MKLCYLKQRQANWANFKELNYMVTCKYIYANIRLHAISIYYVPTNYVQNSQSHLCRHNGRCQRCNTLLNVNDDHMYSIFIIVFKLRCPGFIINKVCNWLSEKKRQNATFSTPYSTFLSILLPPVHRRHWLLCLITLFLAKMALYL